MTKNIQCANIKKVIKRERRVKLIRIIERVYMKDIIKNEKKNKLDRPITGIIQEDRIWEQWYSQSIFDMELPKMNQRDYLFKCNENYRNQVILNNRNLKKYSVSKFEQLVDQFVKAFIAFGISKGSIICTVGLSTPELVAIKYAASTLGIITSNLNFMDGETIDGNIDLNQLYIQIKTINPALIFTLDILENKVSNILNLPEFNGIMKVGMPLTRSTPLWNIERGKIQLLKLRNRLVKENVLNSYSLEEFLLAGQAIATPEESVYTPGLPSNISFTSGTTNQNKAVLLSHDANNALAFQHQVADLELRRGAKHLALVPPFLAFWDADIIHMAMCMGVENILELSLTYENIPLYLKKYLPQYGIWSQYLWDSLLHVPKKDREEIARHLEKVVVGGERNERNQAETFYDMTGIVQETGFGATEINTCFTFTHPSCNKIGSAGIPLPYNNVKIVDENFQDVTYGVPGRLLVSGPGLMNGYYGRNDLTKKALGIDSKGTIWYDTADYAVMDEDGCLLVLDRYKKPMVIHDRQGVAERVNPLDIVEKIKTNRNIKICKLENHGEYMVLYVVINEFCELSKEEAISSVKQTIEENLPEKYWPNVINVLDSLPRTAVGKVDYKKLRESTISLYEGVSEWTELKEKLQIVDQTTKGKVKTYQKIADTNR